MVQELKLRACVTAESILESNDDFLLLQRMKQVIPEELIKLNLLWVYDQFANKERGLHYKSELFTPLIGLEYTVNYFYFVSTGLLIETFKKNLSITNVENV